MRQSGVLLHITSLPSRGGIGTLGQAAYDFVDFVKASGMNLWQMLPIGPTGYAESPYQSTSTFAGNPLMIDFDLLEADGILPAGIYQPLDSLPQVDFEAVKAQNSELLRLAFRASQENLAGALADFSEAYPWVKDYGLFRAIKTKFGEVSWMDWPDQDIRLRKSEAVERYAAELADEAEYYIFEQYLFFDQWQRLHEYARQNGVSLMGDMPIYVAEDSCDVWLNPDMFELDEDCKPIRIAGVPPDYFQVNGQRWGNPLYAWKKHPRPATAGGSRGFAPWATCSTSCASTTSSASPTTTPSPPRRRRPATASTSSARAGSCSAASGRRCPI